MKRLITDDVCLKILADVAARKVHKKPRITATAPPPTVEHKTKLPYFFDAIDRKTMRVWISFKSRSLKNGPEVKVCLYQIPVEVFEVLERSNPIVSINTGFDKKVIRWHEAVVLRRFGIKNHQRGEECFYDARALLLSLHDTYQHAGDLLNSLAKLTIMSDLSLSWDHKEIMANCLFHEKKQQDGIAKNLLKDLCLCTDDWDRYVLDFVSKNKQYKSMGMPDFVLWCRRPENTKIVSETSNKLYHFSGYMEFIQHQRDRSVQSENDILMRMVYGKTRNPPRNHITSFLGVLWCKSKNCRVLAERVAKEIRILEMTTTLLQSPPVPTGYHRIVIK